MDANTINNITFLAQSVINKEKAARDTLAKSLTDMTRGVEPSAMRRVMEMAAEALPYRMLLEDAEGGDFEKAFTTLRKRLTRQLLTTGPSSSTCQLTNEAERLRLDGYRAFLSATDDYLA